MFDNTETKAINKTDDSDNLKLISKQKLNPNNVDILNTNNNGLFKNIYYFDKMNTKELEPTTQNINETIFEEDLSIMVDELVNNTYNEVNEGKGSVVRKQHFLDYLDNHRVNLQEIYKWLLNNQVDSNSIYLLVYFVYNGIGTNVNKKEAFKLYQKASELEISVAQLSLAKIY